MGTIIVIEDDNFMREDIVSILELEDFTVLGAASGEAGLDLLNTHTVDLILCDVWMPGMNGFEVLEKVQANDSWRQLPFLFLSANSGQDFIDKGEALGATDYIVKPFTVDTLIETLKKYLT